MAVFEVVDEAARTAAKENYRTFTSLVRFLVGRCSSDLDKARAIFKWVSELKWYLEILIRLSIYAYVHCKYITWFFSFLDWCQKIFAI